MEQKSLFYDLVKIRIQTTSRSKISAMAYKGYAKLWKLGLSPGPSRLL